jgi:hypothetical protein
MRGEPDNIFSAGFLLRGRSRAMTADLLRREIRQIVAEAVRQFGARVDGLSLHSVFFHPRGLAQIARLQSYPEDHSGLKELVITLPEAAAADEATRLFFLAHECVHFICGARIPDICYLEEGLCEDFAGEYTHEHAQGSFRRDYTGANSVYDDAVLLFRQFDQQYPAAVRSLRANRPYLSPLNVAELAAVAPACQEVLLRGLALKFPEMN